ncbi:unnamed protein product [Ixodes pacificus]
MALSSAVKMLIWTASWRVALLCRTHSEKWSSIWSRCLNATWGKTRPYRTTDMSITATPRGSGPGNASPCTCLCTLLSDLYSAVVSCSNAPEPEALFGCNCNEKQ